MQIILGKTVRVFIFTESSVGSSSESSAKITKPLEQTGQKQDARLSRG